MRCFDDGYKKPPQTPEAGREGTSSSHRVWYMVMSSDQTSRSHRRKKVGKQHLMWKRRGNGIKQRDRNKLGQCANKRRAMKQSHYLEYRGRTFAYDRKY